MKRFFFILSIATLSFSSVAKDKSLETEFAICANKSEMADRLICYDTLASKRDLLNKTESSNSDTGNWVVDVETSPIDDSKTVFMSNLATDSSRVGYRDVRPSVHLRCQEGQLDFYISWNVFIGTDSALVTMRFGKNDAYDESWSISTNNKATFARHPDIKLRFLEKADTFLARVTPYSENPILAEFDIEGLSEAAKPLKQACGID